ncbi:hypothetical protein V5P93_003806 [Actinokineospora auranticolor]|uniref:Uncharacterized protein n=1 Tax=Actinokineospora auranticolor TaxID=155976 RepID=A0A2S6GLI1_9PSEU|nr:hypothetical protein [Actinokineospora auranticolor]PPK66092.1 hypothetical protein CLV40_11156 [Actinokineospora auranticolor]
MWKIVPAARWLAAALLVVGPLVGLWFGVGHLLGYPKWLPHDGFLIVDRCDEVMGSWQCNGAVVPADPSKTGRISYYTVDSLPQSLPEGTRLPTQIRSGDTGDMVTGLTSTAFLFAVAVPLVVCGVMLARTAAGHRVHFDAGFPTHVLFGVTLAAGLALALVSGIVIELLV